MHAADIRAAVHRLQTLDALDDLTGLPRPSTAGWARDGVWTDADGAWPGDVRDAALVSVWTPTCRRCDVGDRAVAAVVVTDTSLITAEQADTYPDVTVHAWLLGGDDIMTHTTLGSRLHAAQPGLPAIHALQADLAGIWHPSELLRPGD